MTTTVWRYNLVAALRMAIKAKEAEERALGYSSDSGLLAGWRQVYLDLMNGDDLEVIGEAV